VTEQLVVAVAGAAVGVAIAFVAFDAIVGLLPRSLPQKALIALNGRVLAASIGVTLLAALVVGLIPAIQASSFGLRRGLSDNDRGSTPGARRLRWTLVVGELALGVMLLVGALLMIRTFLTLRPDAPGFDPTNKLISLVRLPASTAVDERRQFVAEVSRQLTDVPGVAAVAHASHYPMSGSVFVGTMTVDDHAAEAYFARISANYLDVMRIPVIRGRGFIESDSSGPEPVALVSETFVKRWLAGREPLNAIVTIGPGPMASIKRRIVGVVADTRFSGSDTRPRPYVYGPFSQEPTSSAYFIVSGGPAVLAGVPDTLRQVVTRLRPGQLVDNTDRFENLLAGQVSYPRLGAWLLGIFGGLAVMLAAIGLGSTLAWSVAERRREIGVRMALGAPPNRIVGLVLKQTLVLSSLAIGLGLAAAVFASRLIEGWLYGVARTDVTTYAVCGAAILVVALVSAYLPAHRATQVDPLTTLRAD
jgi:predicted permease